MNFSRRIVVIHTAFLGDIILALPMVQALKRSMPDYSVSFVAIPAACAVLMNHPSINQIIEYDKKGKARGLKGMMRCIRQLKEQKFDTAIVPHRSLRSALLPVLAGIPRRVGFTTSAGSFLFTDKVRYESDRHEIVRNLDLLSPLGIEASLELPSLYPSSEDVEVVGRLLAAAFATAGPGQQLVCVAPGSVWETKRWPEEKFAALTRLLADAGERIVLIGGEDDRALCDRVGGKNESVVNAAGRLTILQSAEVVRRCAVLVSNDSAPMHAGVAMRTPVVAIFGATIPGFGFAPVGENDRIHQTEGLTCRPCSIHGGNKCPIRTFDCMHRIRPEDIFESVLEILQNRHKAAGHFQKRSSQ